jgi:hypothetical protein
MATIFSNTEDYKSVVPFIHRNFKWEQLSVVCEQAAKRFVIPYVGQAVYDKCKTAHSAPNDLGAEKDQYETLLIRMREVVAYYAYALLHDMGNVHISEMGIQQSYSSDGGSSPASQWARLDSKRETLNYADSSIDAMIVFMENAMKGNDHYADWKTSEAWKQLSGLFIYLSSQLRLEIDQASWRLLMGLRGTMRYIQQRDIKPLLGDTFYDNLIEAIQEQGSANQLSDEEEKLLKYIRAYLARRTMQEAIPQLRVSYENGGLFVTSYDGPASQALKAATDANTRHLLQIMGAQADSCQTALTRFLNENAANYADYSAPDLEGPDGDDQYGKRITRFKGSIRI